MKKTNLFISLFAVLMTALFVFNPVASNAASEGVATIKKRGGLRHLGIPYANFITGSGEGLEVEVMKRFAKHLGVKYKFVKSGWGTIFSDLVGKNVALDGTQVTLSGQIPIKGDIIATGLTELDWRKKILDYSVPTFPTQVWCIAAADFPAAPITTSKDIHKDIEQVKQLLQGKKVMGKAGTCLAPGLYGIDSSVAEIINFSGNLNDIAPAIIRGKADIALLDVPDALVALEKWPGKIKVLGPLSEKQTMGAGFRKEDADLRSEFNAFFQQLKASGEYKRLVHEYYPAVFKYFGAFFEQ